MSGERVRVSGDPVKVLYIEGAGRSGSTVLDNLLGQLPGFFSVGELRFVWDRNLLEDRLCGCGRPFGSCPVWSEVVGRAFGGGAVDPHEMIRLREGAVRLRDTPLAATRWAERLLRPRSAGYLDVLARLYPAVAGVTGARVVVDSSKYPSYGLLLGMLPTVDLYVLHLVRDPRGVAHSLRRVKPEPVARGVFEEMQRTGPARSAVDWSLCNLLAETFARRARDRYLPVRYEDFVAEPRATVLRILGHVGEPARELPFVGERAVRLGVNHTVSGNPSRFRTGTVELRPDDEWRTRGRPAGRALVTALCLPLLARYGYVGRGRRRRTHPA
ncbi:MAG TPA: sulfotransferase [Actinomycetota bacterium]|nr:sulfotransferase [Actinomycetota bacterium]